MQLGFSDLNSRAEWHLWTYALWTNSIYSPIVDWIYNILNFSVKTTIYTFLISLIKTILEIFIIIFEYIKIYKHTYHSFLFNHYLLYIKVSRISITVTNSNPMYKKILDFHELKQNWGVGLIQSSANWFRNSQYRRIITKTQINFISKKNCVVCSYYTRIRLSSWFTDIIYYFLNQPEAFNRSAHLSCTIQITKKRYIAIEMPSTTSPRLLMMRFKCFDDLW